MNEALEALRTGLGGNMVHLEIQPNGFLEHTRPHARRPPGSPFDNLVDIVAMVRKQDHPVKDKAAPVDTTMYMIMSYLDSTSDMMSHDEIVPIMALFKRTLIENLGNHVQMFKLLGLKKSRPGMTQEMIEAAIADPLCPDRSPFLVYLSRLIGKSIVVGTVEVDVLKVAAPYERCVVFDKDDRLVGEVARSEWLRGEFLRRHPCPSAALDGMRVRDLRDLANGLSIPGPGSFEKVGKLDLRREVLAALVGPARMDI